MSRPTVRDVARLSGLSLATVSRALNHSTSVSESALERVREAVRELDFRPSEAARNLRRSRTGAIGLVLPNLTNPFFPMLMQQTSQLAHGNGYRVILCADSPLRDAINLARSQAVDGIVFVGEGRDDEPVALTDFDVPLVAFDRAPRDLPTTLYQVDNEHGARVVTQHLIDLGHKRILHIHGPIDLRVSRQRMAGFEAALRGSGAIGQLLAGDFLEDSGYAAARLALESADRPTAIFAANDAMAIGALRAAREVGLRVPADVAVAGFDGLNITKYVTPQLTTYRQPVELLARLTVERLLEAIDDRSTLANADQKQLVHLVQGEFVARESTIGGGE